MNSGMRKPKPIQVRQILALHQLGKMTEDDEQDQRAAEYVDARRGCCPRDIAVLKALPHKPDMPETRFDPLSDDG